MASTDDQSQPAEVGAFSVWVRLRVRQGSEEEFMAAIADNARDSVDREPGCLSFDIVRLDEDERCFAFYEVYRDRRAFEVEHRAAAHYARWRVAADRTVVPGSMVVTAGIRMASPGAPVS